MIRGMNLKGIKFGRLKALKANGRNKEGLINWKCLCDCGQIVTVPSAKLKKGNTKSCGCLQREKAVVLGLNNRRHGHTCRVGTGATSEYTAWRSMKSRCFNKNTSGYKYYGARGISVCKRWLSFENFFNDMGPKPNGLSLERIDNSRGYSPGNCKWATVAEQNRNKRNARLLTHGDITLTIAEWTRKLGLRSSRIYDWLRYGYSFESLIEKI